MRRVFSRYLLSFAMGMSLVPVTHATLTVYTSRETFLAAIDSPDYIETFNGLPLSPQQPVCFSHQGFNYQASTGSNGFVNAGSRQSGDVWLSINSTAEPIQFSDFSNNVEAIGGYFFTSGVDGTFLKGGKINLTAVDVNDSQTLELTSSSRTDFIGLVSDTGFVSLTLTTEITGSSNRAWPTANDFIVGSTLGVPEANTWGAVVLGGGLLLVTWARRGHVRERSLPAGMNSRRQRIQY